MSMEIYPDELISSFMARMHWIRGHKSIRATYNNLLELRAGRPVHDLPSGLVTFIQKFKFKCSVEELIYSHTLYPYYQPFWSEQQRRRVKKEMLSDKSQITHLVSGVMPSVIKTHKQLKLCPLCIQQDEQRYGEPYWHRAHQLPGVWACPTHHCVLMDKCFECGDGFLDHRIQYPTLLSGFCKNQHSLAHVIYPEKDMDVLQLANTSRFILHGGYSQLNHMLMYKRIMDQLCRLDLCTVAGRVRQREVRERFFSKFNSTFLSRIGVPLPTSNEFSWLSTILRKPRQSQHPLLYILCIHLLWDQPEDLLQEESSSPFGTGPWPCLNKVSDHEYVKSINKVKITACSKTRKPVGVFECPICGFTYSRKGPDRKKEHVSEISTIRNFGFVWENQLNVLLEEDSLSVRAIARLMKCDSKTVMNYKHKRNAKENKVDPMSENHSRRKQKIKPFTCKENLPLSYERVDWKRRDLEINDRMLHAIDQLQNSKDKPIRITKTRVGRMIGCSGMLEKHLDKLPCCKATLAEHVEPIQQYQKRKIHWAIQECVNNKVTLKKWVILRKAGMNNSNFRTLDDYIFEQIACLNCEKQIG
ncbi:hypothetical protein A9P44_20240 [Paenibacillus polymyxa]|nr:TnsD family Tn7-like transposition protein [Paenibacillus polymyxa]OBA03950.1 hypothetical protein A9P44_20240 [Paenibacillus polymyxa]